MKVTFVTYADFGKFSNLKTQDINSTINYFEEKKIDVRIVNRLGRKKNNYFNVLPLPIHFFVGMLGKLFKFFPSRKIEEKIFDFFASSTHFSRGEIVFFHPPKFPLTIQKAQKSGCICIGIAVNAHPESVKNLYLQELKNQNVNNFKMNQIIENDFSMNMDYLITLSEYSKMTYVNNGYPEEKIFVANLDVNLNKFYPQQSTNKTFTVIFLASSMGLLKGLQYLIDAWSELNIKDKKLIILGKRYQWPKLLEKKYKKIIQRDKTISEIGIVKDPEKYLQKSDLAVLPSHSEGFGKSISEAMACGIPAIITANSTDTKNLFIDKKHGIIVPISNSIEITKALYYFSRNPNDLKKMGEEAFFCIKNKKPFSNRVFEIFEEIIS